MEPPFLSTVRATGQAEVWTHNNEAEKLKEFGWRCTTSESGYKPKTLIGNWSEERFDLKETRKPAILPSDHAHYFDSTYNSSFNKQGVKPTAPLSGERVIRSFPGHQPDVTSPNGQAVANTWETTTRAAYIAPKVQRISLS